MSSPWVIGGGAGLLAAATAVASNLWRGDPHLVSTAPDLLTLVIVGGLVWLAVKRVAAHDRARAVRAGRHAALAASGTFAVGMGAFTWWYLPSHAFALAGFLSGFAMVYLVGFVAVRIAPTRVA
jgi:hypothetical protein